MCVRVCACMIRCPIVARRRGSYVLLPPNVSCHRDGLRYKLIPLRISIDDLHNLGMEGGKIVYLFIHYAVERIETET